MPDEPTQTYYSITVAKDTAFWVNVVAFFAAAVELNANIIPDRYNGALAALVATANLFVRFFLTTRPAAIRSGTPVQVARVAPKPPDPKE
jgi:hypothetical protein